VCCLKSDDTGTIEATVDDVHYHVEEAQLPEVPAGFVRVERITNNGFENSAHALALEPFRRREASGGPVRPAALVVPKVDAQTRVRRQVCVQARPTSAAGRTGPPEASRRLPFVVAAVLFAMP